MAQRANSDEKTAAAPASAGRADRTVRARARGLATTVQAVPPGAAPGTIARPKLERRLDEALGRRLTVLIADPGAGKSTLLSGWAGRHGAAWYTLTDADRELSHLARGLLAGLSLRVPALPRAVGGLLENALGPDATADERSRARACAGLVADALATNMGRDLALVLDDVHELQADDPGTWLVEALCRQAPPRLHLVLASRTALPFSIERLRGHGQATSIPGAALAFDADEVATLVEGSLGGRDPSLEELLASATAGWPAAVRLAVEALVGVPPGDRADVARRFLGPAGALYDYLAEEVLGRTPAEVREVLAAVAPLPRFNAAVCEAMGIAGAGVIIRALEERGLFVRPLGADDWSTLHPLIRDHLLSRPDGRRLEQLAAAARWLEQHGADRDAIACWRAIDDPAGAAGVLERRGAEMLARGEVEAVVDAAAGLPAAMHSQVIDRLEGEARQIRGDWEGALRCFRSVAPPGAPIDPGIAWRMGLIHHLRGELDEALETYRRGRPTDTTAPPDVALLEAWTASALWLRGDPEACRATASRALELATASGDDRALAAAHTIAAMVAALDGDRRANDAHYIRALDHAGRAGDLLQAIRIRANRGSRLVEEGYYDEAVDELTTAIGLAEVAGFAAFHGLALSNRGEALRRLGRLDEAISDLEAARELYQRLESRMVAYPLSHLADVQAERGAFAVARAQHEEALTVAEGAGDVQGLRPALAGLAELLARDDPERAAVLAERAVAFGPGIGLVRAWLASGAVALALGRPDAARAAAMAGAAEARTRRDRAGLAEALELEGAAAGDAETEARHLREALVIWRDLRCPLPAARVELRLGELGAPIEGDPEGVLRAAGAAATPVAARLERRERSAASPGQAHAALRVRTFGGFEVARDGDVVTTAAWGSRKARDLFKILIVRQGRHVPREQLEELLWPAEDPDRSARRLSVAISTVRSALDPAHAYPANHFVAADRAAAWLVLEHVDLDLAAFLHDAALGLELAARGSPEALVALRSAETTHRGEFLVEDAFEDWAAALREECRQTYIGVGHALAAAAAAVDDHEAAARYLRRVLQYDDYDERAHLGLVSALAAGGHPADARRAYGSYLARMAELAVEAAPFPA